jgi:Flp pilus assembly protein TadD
VTWGHRFGWCLLFGTSVLDAQTVTFNRDIAPVVFQYCAPCHRPGEAAPFPLLTYDDVKRHAAQIAAVTASRYMPPWLPEPGKGEFEGERRLNDTQIAAIRRWAANGTPEGKPGDLPSRPRFTEGWQLGTPDLVVALDRPFTLAPSGSDVFRNFVLRVPITARRFVRALEIRPGNKRIVHHANVLIDRTASARSRDGQDGSPGFEGMDVKLETAGFEPDTHFLFWKPGTVYSSEPQDMAWQLDPGTDLVLNMHLQPTGKPEVLQPSIGLYFTDQAPAKLPMLVQLENDGALDISAGKRDFVVTDHLRLPIDVDLLGVYPHAHYAGRDMQALATLPDGTKRWLIHIPNWDINWQAVYRYRTPVFLPKGSVISMRYTYDNSAENPRNPNHPPQRIVNGDRSTDEMAHLWLQVLPRGEKGAGDPRMVLQQAVMHRRLEKYPRDFLAQYTLAAMLEAGGRHGEASDLFRKALAVRPRDATAHNSLGITLSASGKVEDAISHFQSALENRPNYAYAHYNLGRSLLTIGRFDEAILHLRKALEIEPADAAALTNLGVALYSSGKTAEGLEKLRSAVKILPNYFEGRYNLGLALAGSGELDGAVTELRAALTLRPNDVDSHTALAMVLSQKNDLRGAEKEWVEALRLDPGNEEARKNLRSVQRQLGK